jgi:hypothetical protein
MNIASGSDDAGAADRKRPPGDVGATARSRQAPQSGNWPACRPANACSRGRSSPTACSTPARIASSFRPCRRWTRPWTPHSPAGWTSGRRKASPTYRSAPWSARRFACWRRSCGRFSRKGARCSCSMTAPSRATRACAGSPGSPSRRCWRIRPSASSSPTGARDRSRKRCGPACRRCRSRGSGITGSMPGWPRR